MKTVIEMAREAGFGEDTGVIFAHDRDGVCTEELKAFTALVRADEREAFAKIQFESILQAMRIEREACAKVCESWLGRYPAIEIMNAIRARSNT